MKRIWIVVVMVVLMGCQISESSLTSRMNTRISEIEGLKAAAVTNHRRSYFDYYLPKHIGKRFSDMDNVVFVKGQQKFYMYLHVSDIIIDTYYNNTSSRATKDEVRIGESVYHKKGTMKNSEGLEQIYDLTIERIQTRYVLSLRYGSIQFMALLPLSELEEMVYDMFMIARSMVIDTDAVLADYSNKSVVVITNKYDLFEIMFPESGVIAHVLGDESIGTIHEENTAPEFSEREPDDMIHEEPTGNSEDGAEEGINEQ